MKKLTCAAAVFISVASAAVQAKPPTVPLECGKASAAVAQRQYLDAASGGGDIYNVMVTFTGKKPTNSKVESVLRECIAAAVKKDASKDILATAWLKRRIGASEDDDQQINPFGGLKYISYTAATKTVTVHELKMNRQ
jgi:hypothetical protein